MPTATPPKVYRKYTRHPKPDVAPVAAIIETAPVVIHPPDPEPVELPTMEVPSGIAALIFRAKYEPGGNFSDVRGNQARRNSDGTVRLSLKQPDKSHKRIMVLVPPVLTFTVVSEG